MSLQTSTLLLRTTRYRVLATLFLGLARAQDVALHNATSLFGPDSVELALIDMYGGRVVREVPIAALGTSDVGNIASDSLSIEGTTLLADASSQLSIASDNIAFISCDPYSGNIQPANVFETATERNATAIILYSESLPSCRLGLQEQYGRVYTMMNQNYTHEMLEAVTSMGVSYARIASRDTLAASSDGNATSNGTNGTGNGIQNNPSLGASPGTAVAMIILYSITGIITALFLIIIITGAVRAHRHPERYGPRNAIGRLRQIRARGLAMAMLETIPIVKFGGRGEEAVKPADVELGNAPAGGEVQPLPEHESAQTAIAKPGERSEASMEGTTGADGTTEHLPDHGTVKVPAQSSTVIQQSQAPDLSAGAAERFEESSNLGCSICTEDFQIGEDQRVLPCDHRFHPACIDPWLLNVSGTCPLCRIDLRPTTSRTECGSREGDAEDGLAPPLNETRRRTGRLSYLGSLRPERMTREQRVRALRQHREEQRQGGQEEREERGVRERLRRVLRVRTRRMGDEGEGQNESAAEPSRR